MYNFSFYCKESRVDRNGLATIELSIAIDGKRLFIPLPRKAKPSEFKVLIKSKRNNDILEYTSLIRIKLNKYINEMLSNDIPITADTLKDYFKNGGVKSYMLYDVIAEFLTFQSKKTSAEAVKKYELATTKFKEHIGKNVDIKFITTQDVEEFKLSLKEKGFEESTTNYILARNKALFTYAHNKNYITVNPMAFITISKKQKDVEYLTNEEVERIINKDFGNDRLNKVKDLFIFQCETATAFADMQQISFLDIKNDDGVYYVNKKRQKTGIEFFTIITPIAMNILKKYNFNLNIISNQKCNAYLKEIADICRIDKPLHTHIARHTAATRLLNSGFRIEIVSKILGHTNTRQTSHYAKLVDKTVLNEFKKIG